MKKYIFDVEVYLNFFCVSFKEYNTDNILYFEISKRANNRDELIKFLKTPHILIGFNSINYDNKILNGVFKGLNNSSLKELSDDIINNNIYKLFKYKKKQFTSVDIDLYLYWPRLIRISKKISLKGLAAQLRYDNIQELPYHESMVLTESQMEVVKNYNINDLKETELLCNKMEDKIKFRFEVKNKYKFNCLSWDDVKIGAQILYKNYINYIGIDELSEPDNKQQVAINDIILPAVEFKKRAISIRRRGSTMICNNFYSMFEHIKERVVTGTDELDYTVYYGGVKHDIKSGGIHSYHNPTIYESNGQIIQDIDVSSYYPSLGIEWSVSPDHLTGLSDMLRGVKKERLEHKKSGNKLESEALKLAMNGGYYGNLNNKYSWLFDWEKTLKITINGQLFLCMLSEWFTDNDIQVLMLNTDGITVRYPEDKKQLVTELISKWENVSKMEMESNFYERLVVRDVNNYIWIKKDGSYKTKGAFKLYDERPLGDNTDFCILAKAWVEYFVNGVPVENTIKDEQNIYMFCKSPKVDRTYTVYHNGRKQQNLNRFFVRNNGAYLYKKKEGGNLQNMLVGYPVEILNKCTDTNAFNYDINYDYYITKAKELIENIEPKQLTLL